MDNNWGGTIDQGQFGHQGKCARGENECFIWISCYRIVDWTFKGVQRRIFTYKNLKGIPLEIAQHEIEFDTIVPLVH